MVMLFSLREKWISVCGITLLMCMSGLAVIYLLDVIMMHSAAYGKHWLTVGSAAYDVFSKT